MNRLTGDIPNFRMDSKATLQPAYQQYNDWVVAVGGSRQGVALFARGSILVSLIERCPMLQTLIRPVGLHPGLTNYLVFRSLIHRTA